jgi:hypothetical protein
VVRLEQEIPDAGLSPSLRSAASAKSIIMMAFFFTSPMGRMIPIAVRRSQRDVKRTR